MVLNRARVKLRPQTVVSTPVCRGWPSRNGARGGCPGILSHNSAHYAALRAEFSSSICRKRALARGANAGSRGLMFVSPRSVTTSNGCASSPKRWNSPITSAPDPAAGNTLMPVSSAPIVILAEDAEDIPFRALCMSPKTWPPRKSRSNILELPTMSPATSLAQQGLQWYNLPACCAGLPRSLMLVGVRGSKM